MTAVNNPDGSYNYVLDPSISKKEVPTGEGNNPWAQFKDSYINYFNPENKDLNRVENMAKIPEAETEPYYGVNDRIYYPVVYTKENTLDREAQVNGYSTGVIFESEFMPDGDNFKVSFYNEKTGSIESVPLDDNKTFLLAVHKNSVGATVRSVYKDLPSVAACAFNLEEGSDPNLLKGLMNGWDEVTLPKFADVQKAINSMSDQNGFEIAFKKYLSDMIKGETNWTDGLKRTYAILNLEGNKMRVTKVISLIPALIRINSPRSRSVICTNSTTFPYTKAERAITSSGSVITITGTMV